MRVLVANGPNLDLLGTRQPEVYGTATLADIHKDVTGAGARLGVDVQTFQSNHEGELVERLHQADFDALVVNPGALTHTSRALADAIAAVGRPAVEVHISNVREREAWRAVSYISPVCVRTIYGRGIDGYVDAIRHLHNREAFPFTTVRYGPHPEQVGDFREAGQTLVVLIHGGVWRHEYERDTTESLAVDLARRGTSSFNIEYRRIGAGGGWPASGHDALMALDFVPQLGRGERPVAVVGHSAGGYLAMWAAPRSRTAISVVAGLAPVADLEDAVSEGAVLSRESAHLLAHGAPARLGPGSVRMVSVHGRDDSIVPVRHSEGLAAGAGVELMTFDGGHFELLDPTRAQWEWVVERITDST